jgi:hypothetical protein
MRNFILLLIFFVSLPLYARDVYKWVTEDGSVIYSDTYVEGAERISVSDSKPDSSAAETDEDQAETTGEPAEGAVSYKSLEIVQPANDATVRSNEGSLAVGLALSPGLAEGHAVKIVIDGTELEGEMKSTQFSIGNLNRGTHSLVTKVVDADGNVLITSNSVTFHLRQASILTPTP